jgi:hypothetical protein
MAKSKEKPKPKKPSIQTTEDDGETNPKKPPTDE